MVRDNEQVIQSPIVVNDPTNIRVYTNNNNDAAQVNDDHLILTEDSTTENLKESYASMSDSDKIDMALVKIDAIMSKLDRIESALLASNRLSTSTTNSGGAIGGASKAKLARAWPDPYRKSGKSTSASSSQEPNLHFYDNQYHVFPQDWVLPRLSFEGLMVYWFLGDPSVGVPPLMNVGGSEFKNLSRGVRKRSDMKYLMKHVERKGREAGCYIDDFNDWTDDAVRNLYAKVRKYFEYATKSSAQTKFDKLSWETVCHNVRKAKGILVGENPPEPSSITAIDIQSPVESETVVDTVINDDDANMEMTNSSKDNTDEVAV